MTPGGYEEAGMAGAEFNPTKGEKNSQGHKTTTKLKTSVSNKRDSNCHPLKGIETRLPEPQYRTVAGHVSRRANTSAAADPPPPPASIRATSSNQRRERRKKTDGGGLGDDSDDSDSGDQKPGQGNDTPGASSRRRRPQPQNDPEPTSAGVSSRPFESLQSKPLQFSREEQERLDRRRELRAISSIWENTKQLRCQNSAQGAERKAQLMDYIWASESLKHPNNFSIFNSSMKLLHACSRRLDEYLERSLHRAAIESITDEVSHVVETTNQFIQKLEQNVIQACEMVNSARHDPTLATHHRIETMDMALRYVVEAISSARAMEIPMDVNDFHEHCTSPEACGADKTAEKVFATAFISKMVGCVKRERDCLESPLEEALSANAIGSQRTQFFLLNREQRGITNAYMEWLCEGVDIESIKNCPVGLLDGLRAMQRLKTLREGTRQVFICQSEGVHGTSCLRVSLVMFKGNQPLRIQRVSRSELSQMGWIPDAHTPSFWRSSLLEASVAGKRRTRKALFKVDMDGAVLAIQRSDGQWFDWKDIEGGE